MFDKFYLKEKASFILSERWVPPLGGLAPPKGGTTNWNAPPKGGTTNWNVNP